MSIDTLKSTISKRGGLAKANRFNLTSKILIYKAIKI